MLSYTFFGHKNILKEIESALRSTLIDLIKNKNVCNFMVKRKFSYQLCGGSCLPSRREIHPEEESATDTSLPDGIQAVSRNFTVNYRNQWMIERSDHAVAYVKYTVGSAVQFKELAEKKKRIVIS